MNITQTFGEYTPSQDITFIISLSKLFIKDAHGNEDLLTHAFKTLLMEFGGSKKTSKQILNKRDSVMNSITCTHMYSQPCHQLLCFTLYMYTHLFKLCDCEWINLVLYCIVLLCCY